jgi:hypothetical protein
MQAWKACSTEGDGMQRAIRSGQRLERVLVDGAARLRRIRRICFVTRAGISEGEAQSHCLSSMQPRKACSAGVILSRNLISLRHGKVPTLKKGLAARLGSAPLQSFCFAVLLVSCGLAEGASGGDWSAGAQLLARKVVAVTGPGAVALTVENRSSLAKKDVDVISRALRVELEALGTPAAQPAQAASAVAVWLSQDPQAYVWIAEIRQGAGQPAVVMVSVSRRDDIGLPRESAPVSLRKIPLWAQEDRILDVVVLEEDSAPKQIAVLDGEKVSIYRFKGRKWQAEQSLGITHVRPWPRDLRGRMVAAKDHLLDVYLPGVFCRSSASLPLALNCGESDDPWPLLTTPGAAQPMGAFYSDSRNFFTGVLTPGGGRLTTVGKFYSAAALPRANYTLWLFASTEGQIHLVDGVTDRVAKLGWGSDIASVTTGCGSGTQVLATAARVTENGIDSARAYEIADRDPVPVSAALDFSGEITALWAEAKGDRAVVVARNRETGEYEAFRLAVACSQ